MRRLPALSVVVLALATLSLPGTTALGQQLAYRLPSQTTATYQMVDSTGTRAGTPDDASDMFANSTVTYTLSFEAEGNSIRASADLTAFEAQMQLPSGARRPVSQSEAGIGSFAVLLNARGLENSVSGQSRSYSEFPLLVDPYEAFFPRLPGGEVERGDSWIDTVSTTSAAGLKRVVVYEYTLVSDTVVGGRAQLKVAVSGDSRLTSNQDGDSITLTGPETGFFLWDIERGLVALWEVSRRYEGSMPGFPNARISFDSTTRVRLDSS